MRYYVIYEYLIIIFQQLDEAHGRATIESLEHCPFSMTPINGTNMFLIKIWKDCAGSSSDLCYCSKVC